MKIINNFECKYINCDIEQFITYETLVNRTNQLFVILKDNSQVEDLANRLSKENLIYFYDFEISPYYFDTNNYQRIHDNFNNLTKLLSLNKFILITTFSYLYKKLPPVEFIQSNFLKLQKDEIYEHSNISYELFNKGYQNTSFIEEPGDFAFRGEILDIYLSEDAAYRIHFFDEIIESIFKIDIVTKLTLKHQEIETLSIPPSVKTIYKNISVFQENTQSLSSSIDFKQDRKKVISSIKEYEWLPQIENLIPSFFDKHNNLFDYIYTKDLKILFNNHENLFENFKGMCNESMIDYQELSSKCILPLKNIYFEEVYTKKTTHCYSNTTLTKNNDYEFKNIKVDSILFSNNKNRGELQILDFLFSKLNKKNRIYFLTNNINANSIIDSIRNYSTLTLGFDITPQINFIHFPISEGFYHNISNCYFFSENDLKSKKIAKTRKRSYDYDYYSEQLATLKINDFIIHKDYGVGKYLGLENINLNQDSSDYLVIEYKDQDKVYLPVYRMDLVQKYASSDASHMLASLKSTRFQKEKQRIKSSVKKLAFSLLEIQAKRKLQNGFEFQNDDKEIFRNFEESFPYIETLDQKSAITDVLEDMESSKSMDRLVCGDVGFGKTEVAMRAAFKAVLNDKQVIILVPTTILAYQHFNTFTERFKNFAVNVDYLSRFKTAKNQNEVINKFNNNQIDILIGTHKVLNSKLNHDNLGLLIVDEEHLFGVGHKEKIKNLKSDVDCLTMTATPIPRTLQLSFMGIRDLSVIKTPPPKKQSIKTIIGEYDKIVIKNAIDYELKRGGQIFFIHNRVNDIELVFSELKQIVPNARVVYAHGQLPERELEQRIKKFFDHDYDVLLSTTIIESGIDLPKANTMIINKANSFGLAQLHQLRGRIGRSDRKAFAYLLIDQSKTISEIALKRLKTLQTYSDIGSGMSIATADLELRGSGDILGAEQKGHINKIGFELYLELLNETISEIKGGKQIVNKNLEINTPYPAFIPDSYIQEPSLRLKYYKKISNIQNENKLNNFIQEFLDLFGLMPKEIENLFKIVEIKLTLKQVPIDLIKVSNKSIFLKFNKQLMDSDTTVKEKLINFFISRPKVYQFNPDYSVKCLFKEIIKLDDLKDFSKLIAQQI